MTASSIGVIARSHQRIREIELCLRRSNIESETVLKDQGDVLSPGVKLTTFHSAKGLEFDHVIVTGLSEGILPENEPLDSAEEDLKEWLAVERRLLYVATTRAKTSLILIAPRPRSRFVDELDSSRTRMETCAVRYESRGGLRCQLTKSFSTTHSVG